MVVQAPVREHLDRVKSFLWCEADHSQAQHVEHLVIVAAPHHWRHGLGLSTRSSSQRAENVPQKILYGKLYSKMQIIPISLSATEDTLWQVVHPKLVARCSEPRAMRVREFGRQPRRASGHAPHAIGHTDPARRGRAFSLAGAHLRPSFLGRRKRTDFGATQR